MNNLAYSSVSWLTHWPAGLKLNSELSLFFGSLYHWMLASWHQVTVTHVGTAPYLPLISIAGRIGATFVFGIILDIISFCTFHLLLLYTVSARLFSCISPSYSRAGLYLLFNI
jgi:phosphatidylinositol glycan class Q protein